MNLEQGQFKFVRVFSEYLDNPSDTLTIDLVVNNDMRVVPMVPSFGVWGNPKAGYVWPFILKTEESNGWVGANFGEEGETRWIGETNVISKIIAPQEIFAMRYQGEEYIYRIKLVTDRLTGSSLQPSVSA